MEAWVIVDTCIWASFFSKPNSAEKRALDALIDADRVAIIGPILTEILLGFRREDQARWVASRLQLIHTIELTTVDWQAAATVGRRLAAQGHKLPITDLIVACIALRNQLSVYSTDPHFDLISNLRRFPA